MGWVKFPRLCSFEDLEPRRHFAAGAWPLSIREVVTDHGTELRVSGTAGHDRISVRALEDGSGYRLSNKGNFSRTVTGEFARIVVTGARGDDRIIIDVATDAVINGGNGNDTINGGRGRDSIYGGNGKDRVLGGAGDDVIVSIGDSRYDRTSGGPGLDSFWTDDHVKEVITDITPEETAANAVHRVGAFESVSSLDVLDAPTSNHLVGQNLPDPSTTMDVTYANFSDRPLFNDDVPVAQDVVQGDVGDCYFLVTLAAVAKANAQLIRQRVAALGDGTFAVRFLQDGLERYFRVDGELPANESGEPLFARLGASGAIWAPVMEKAYAFFRGGVGTYESLDSGWMSEGFAALGVESDELDTAHSGTDLLKFIDRELDAGGAVTFATDDVPDEIPLVEGHAYSIESIRLARSGRPLSVTLRNPWGKDGAGADGANDGYVTLNSADALSAMWTLVYARV